MPSPSTPPSLWRSTMSSQSQGNLLQPQLSYQASYSQLPRSSIAGPEDWVLLPPGEHSFEDVEAMWESKWFGPEEMTLGSWITPQPPARAAGRRSTGLQSAYCKRRPYSFAYQSHPDSGSQTPCWHQSPQQLNSVLQQAPPPVSTPRVPSLSTMQGISNVDDERPMPSYEKSSTSLPTPITCTPFSADFGGARAISDGDGNRGGGVGVGAALQEEGKLNRQERSSSEEPTPVGTWAFRQTRLHGGSAGLQTGSSGPHVLAPIIEGSNHAGAIASAATPPGQNAADISQRSLQQLQQQQQLQEEQQQQQRLQLGDRRDSADSDAETGAAWKWRFARRWHLEQTRPADLEGASPDKTEEALEYLNAGGGTGWNMQVDRTSSASRANSTMHSIGTMPGMGSLLAHEMLLDENLPTTPSVQPGQPNKAASSAISTQAARSRTSWSSEPWQATREVNSLNRRAANLLEQQQRLELEAEERWRMAMPVEDIWLGTYLPAVEIEEWGTFKFLVCRLRGRGGKQRICVRGRNYCSQAQIIEDISRKVQVLAVQHNLAMEQVEIMGGGVMEWRRERDRHLCIYSGYLAQAPAPGVTQASAVTELLNLAAVLTKQSLPAHYKVSIGA